MSRLFEPTLFGQPQEALDFLQAVLESSTEYSIIGKSPDGTIVLWNEGAHRNYGWEPDEVVGKESANILHSADDVRAGLPARMRGESLRDGKWEGVITRVRKDGSTFTARVVMTPRRDAAGHHAGFLLISKNIADEVRLHELLGAQLEAAQQTIRRLSMPILSLETDLLLLPLIGDFDSTRIQHLVPDLLNAIRRSRSRVVVVDVTGLTGVDPEVAMSLLRAVAACRLMGSHLVLCGMSDSDSMVLAGLKVDMAGVDIARDLRDAIERAQQLLSR